MEDKPVKRSAKRLVYIVTTIVVAIIITVSISLTFAIFQNNRTDEATFSVGKVQIVMNVVFYPNPNGGTGVYRVQPNMPVVMSAKFSLDASSRNAYLRATMLYNFCDVNGNILAPTSQEEDYIDAINAYMAQNGENDVYNSSGTGYYWHLNTIDNYYYLTKEGNITTMFKMTQAVNENEVTFIGDVFSYPYWATDVITNKYVKLTITVQAIQADNLVYGASLTPVPATNNYSQISTLLNAAFA